MPPLRVQSLSPRDYAEALEVINTAAAWYREFLPPDELEVPEMTVLDGTGLGRHDAPRMTWYGAYLGADLIGVAALEYVADVALLRHAYVLPEHQRLGAGSALTRHLESRVRGAKRIVVGTYAANYKARSALEKLGYRLALDSEAVLRSYYTIPPERLRGSVAYEKSVLRPRVYRDYDQSALDDQYDQRTLVRDLSPFLDRWRAASAAARAALAVHADLPYGASAAERLDIFAADGARGLVVFLHGGAWRMLTKEESSFPAPSLSRSRISFAAVDFAAVPEVTLREQARQCRSAVAWLYRNAAAWGADHICLLGHSSGAHLAALVATTDWSREEGLPPDVVKGAVLVSGIYDLEPVRLSARNEYLKLDEVAALELSPIRRIRPRGCPVAIAWGGRELAEFQRQSKEFSAAWRAAGNRCEMMPHPTLGHFEMSFPFAEPGQPLHRALLSLAAPPCG